MQMKFLANYSRRAGPSGLGEGLRGGQHHTELLPRTSPSSRCYKKSRKVNSGQQSLLCWVLLWSWSAGGCWSRQLALCSAHKMLLS